MMNMINNSKDNLIDPSLNNGTTEETLGKLPPDQPISPPPPENIAPSPASADGKMPGVVPFSPDTPREPAGVGPSQLSGSPTVSKEPLLQPSFTHGSMPQATPPFVQSTPVPPPPPVSPPSPPPAVFPIPTSSIPSTGIPGMPPVSSLGVQPSPAPAPMSPFQPVGEAGAFKETPKQTAPVAPAVGTQYVPPPQAVEASPLGHESSTIRPSPLASEVDLRTAQSDLESLKQSGGLEAGPKTFSPADLEKGPGLAFTLETPAETEAASQSKKLERKIIIGLIGLAAIGLIVIAVFFIRPMFSPRQPASPVVPAVESPPQKETTPPVETPATEAPAPHVSFFLSVPPDAVETISVAKEGFNFKESLGSLAGEPTATSVKEIIFTLGEAGQPLSFATILSSVLTDLDRAKIEEIFEADATVFVYFDEKGAWPGIIAKVKDGVSEESINNFSQAIEGSDKLAEFFLKPPGTPKEFQDGNVDNRPVRFAGFTNRGFVFDYGWFKKDERTYFMISTSYNGMKEAVRRAGF